MSLSLFVCVCVCRVDWLQPSRERGCVGRNWRRRKEILEVSILIIITYTCIYMFRHTHHTQKREGGREGGRGRREGRGERKGGGEREREGGKEIGAFVICHFLLRHVRVRMVPPMDWEKFLEEIELDVVEEPHRPSTSHITQKKEDSGLM